MEREHIHDYITIGKGSILVGQTIEKIMEMYDVEVYGYNMPICPGAGIFVPLNPGNKIRVEAYPENMEKVTSSPH